MAKSSKDKNRVVKPKDRESTDKAKDAAAEPLRDFNSTNEEKNEAVEKITDLEAKQIEREREALDEIRERGDSQASGPTQDTKHKSV